MLSPRLKSGVCCLGVIGGEFESRELEYIMMILKEMTREPTMKGKMSSRIVLESARMVRVREKAERTMRETRECKVV